MLHAAEVRNARVETIPDFQEKDPAVKRMKERRNDKALRINTGFFKEKKNNTEKIEKLGDQMAKDKSPLSITRHVSDNV